MPRSLRNDERKICRKCQRRKRPDDFGAYPANRDGLQSWCRECRSADLRRRRAATPRNESRLDSFRRMLRHFYDLSLDDWHSLIVGAVGRCEICGADFVDDRGKKNACNIDHCHETEEVRGLLCAACNRALGSVPREDPDVIVEWAEAAAAFLRNPPARRHLLTRIARPGQQLQLPPI